jgi:hypothetical protein
MMATTLTRYLKLKVADELSADAKYNLAQIDSLGASTVVNDDDDLLVKSRGNISLLAQEPSIGGSGDDSGQIFLGDSNNTVSVTAYTTEFRLRSALKLPNGNDGSNDTYLGLSSAEDDVNTTLTISMKDDSDVAASRSIIIGHSGRVVFEDATQALTSKTINGSLNTLSNIAYSSLLLTGNITNTDIATTAAIATSKLSGPLTAVVGNGLGTLAGQNTVSLTGDVTGILPIASGGTGQTTASAAIEGFLPAYATNNNKVLGLDGTGTALEWKTFAAGGTVDAVAAPLTLSLDGKTIGIPVATNLQDGYLSAIDRTTFTGYATSKENTITGSGNPAQFWNGNKTFASVTKSDVGLGNVDNTSDADKPVSTAVSTALSGKEPTITAGTTSQYWRGDKTWYSPVIDSTAGNETDQAPSVASMKSYVAAPGGGSVGYTWSTADGATKSITHSLNKTTVSVSIYDENGEDIFVDIIDRTSSNAVSLTSSIAPTGNWTVIIRP